MFKGSIVAIVTPFSNGAVDEKKLRELVDFQIENGTDAIVACGTTGESSTLDNEEHLNVIKIVFDQAKGRVPVIAGTGSNSTAEAINLTREAKEIGVAGVLLVTPYYNKPTQEGALSSLHGHCRRRGDPPDPLQRTGTHRGQHAARDRGTSG